jgi:DNA mismatch repair protein MutL
MIQQKPFFVLFIELDPRTTDINVHPKKRIVKLQNEMLFLSLLKEGIESKLYLEKEEVQSRHLSDYSFSQSTSKQDHGALTPNPSIQSSRIKPIISDMPMNQRSLYSSNNNFAPLSSPLSMEQLVLNNHNIKKVLGQVQNTYIVCDTDNGIILIDQHAAAERINLEKNRLTHTLSFDKQKLISKKKLEHLSEEHKEILKNETQKLSSLGFEIEKIKQEYFLITIPRFLNNYLDINYFINTLDDLKSKENTVDKLKDNLIKLFTCKNSIKANEPLSYSEQVTLIRELEKCKDKTICAHGRPTIIYFSTKELEKMFKRIV